MGRMKSRNEKHLKMSLQFNTVFASMFDASDPVPLAIGIREAMQAEFPDIKHSTLNQFLCWWCNRPRYLKALACKGSKRYNLAGNETAEVTDEARAFSVEAMEELKALQEPSSEGITNEAREESSQREILDAPH